MTLKEKAAFLWLFSVLGMITVLGLSIIVLPPAMRERGRVSNLRFRLSEKLAEETRAIKLWEEMKKEVEEYRKEVRLIRQRIEIHKFSSKSEKEIPKFIDEIQRIFGESGLNLLQIAYQKRISERGYITVPFEAKFEGKYFKFRNLLGILETHPSGVRIDQLEFIKLDDENHNIQFRIHCSARFKAER